MKHSVGILVHSAAVVAVVAAVFSSCFSFEEPEKKNNEIFKYQYQRIIDTCYG